MKVVAEANTHMCCWYPGEYVSAAHGGRTEKAQGTKTTYREDELLPRAAILSEKSPTPSHKMLVSCKLAVFPTS